MRWLDLRGLQSRCDVYAEDESTGRFTVLVERRVRCRLVHLNVQPGASGGARAELAAGRQLLFDPLVRIPEYAQVEVNGARYNVAAGTFGIIRDRFDRPRYRRCEVTRAGEQGGVTD